MSEAEHGRFQRLTHKAHNGVSLLVMYELFNKLHEFLPEWFNMIKEAIHGIG